MPALLTAADLRPHVETDLDDIALQRVIDRLDADLVSRIGPHSGPLTEVVPGKTPSVYVRRPIATVAGVREGDVIDADATTLTAGLHFRLWAAEGRLERLPAGALFATVVEVVYTPVDDLDRRKRVLLELVRLDLAQSGRLHESVGRDYGYTALDYAAQRDALLRDAMPFLILE